MAVPGGPPLTNGGFGSMAIAVEGPDPSKPNRDYKMMQPYWDMVEAILGGAPAMRAAGEKYLPKFPAETATDYGYRCKNAKFTNIYRDIVESLAAKPFTKEAAIVEKSASEAVLELLEDIDGQGNNFHVFAASVFFQGINDAIDWIFVDKPPVRAGASIAEEKAAGAKPYWVHVPAKSMLAVYSAVINGKEEFINARIYEPEMVKSGYDEVCVERVRELNRPRLDDGSYGPATWTLWELKVDPATKKRSWAAVDAGLIAIGVIAIVPFVTGRRMGSSWAFVPALQDAAYLQVEHYQQETNLKSIKEQACFPMLAGNGVTPPVDDAGKQVTVPVGPKTVLFAPMSSDGGRPGSWTFIEPAAASLTFLAGDVKDTEQNLRELGRQPLTAQTGNLTVVTTVFAAQKGNSLIQAWVLNLKDALEQALKLTCQWLGDSSEPEVEIYRDFSLDMQSDKDLDFLTSLRATKDISRDAVIVEAKRRDILSAEYDPVEDMKLILKEAPPAPTAQDVLDALPPPIKPPGDPEPGA